MKKYISILLIFCALTLCFTSCDVGNDNENPESQAHTEHDNVNGKCSVCNIDYFDILRDIVLENGTPYTNSVITEANGIVKLTVDNGRIVVMAWKNSPDSLQFRYYPTGDTGTYRYLAMQFDRSNIKYSEYNWDFNTDRYSLLDYKSVEGTVVAADLKEITSTLPYTADINVKNPSAEASLAVGYIKKIVSIGIPAVLEYSEYDITAKNFGFVYFD